MSSVGPLLADNHCAAHALNQRFAVEMSSLTLERFSHLAAIAPYARRIGTVDGFIIAVDQTTPYDGENFRWFQARYDRFVYVDRIVVAAHAQGRGLARSLYVDLIAWARSEGQARIACEVNVQPPNPPSQAFHAALGFREVGRGTLNDGVKLVAYLMLELP